MKVLGLVLIVLLLNAAVATSAQTTRFLQAQDDSSIHVRKLPPKESRTSENIYDFVDHAIKEKYWYYLTKACLLYLSVVDRGDGSYQFLAIYRNLVGTFLAITTWTKGSSQFEVNTLVRLGNGLAPGANYKPVAVKPLSVRYKLGDSEVIVDFTDCEDIMVNGKSIFYDCQGDCDRKLVKQCIGFSKFAIQKFWYYLRDAKVVYSSVGKTQVKNYCLIAYVNIVGTFYVIGSHQEGSKPEDYVGTLVRLGNGFEKNSEADYEAHEFNKIHLRLDNYIE